MPKEATAFIDANIFLDILRKRNGWQASYETLKKVRTGQVRGFISTLTVAIIYFYLSIDYSKRKAKAELIKAIRGFEIADITPNDVHLALKDKRIVDFEDAMQFYSAKKVTKMLVTRNTSDFRRVAKEIQILTPEAFLQKYLRE